MAELWLRITGTSDQIIGRPAVVKSRWGDIPQKMYNSSPDMAIRATVYQLSDGTEFIRITTHEEGPIP